VSHLSLHIIKKQKKKKTRLSNAKKTDHFEVHALERSMKNAFLLLEDDAPPRSIVDVLDQSHKTSGMANIGHHKTHSTGGENIMPPPPDPSSEIPKIETY